MARQFRDQLEEEAHNLETKINIDPGIDTSLEPKPAKPAASASTEMVSTTPAPSAAPEPPPEEEFYPPDHHMHPAQRTAAEAPPAEAGLQSELDLTTQRDQDPRAAP